MRCSVAAATGFPSSRTPGSNAMQDPCPGPISAAEPASLDWGCMGRAERDAAYNNTAAVAGAAALREARDGAAAAVRLAFPTLLDRSYGPAPRQRIDLFPA